MKSIPDKAVDLVITSPPYNLGNGHHTGTTKTQAYSDNLPEKEYEKQQIDVLTELYRIVKDDGSIIYNHKNRIKNGQSMTPYKWLLQTPWIIKQELVWFNGSQNFDKIRFYPMTERLYWMAKRPDTVLYNALNHHDVFKWEAVGADGEHTRAFPAQMVESLLLCFPNALTILDPYSGSGTTCYVARALHRNFIGVEKEKKYCQIAETRLSAVQVALF